MLTIGIDISKASFGVAFLQDSSYQNKRFNNNTKGFKALQKQLKPIRQTQVFIYIIKPSNIKNNIFLNIERKKK